MHTYGRFRPTQFDHNIDINRADWHVVPVSQTRDSGPLDRSNFDAAIKMLGGEGDDVEVHRFGHWGPGWFEIILVRPGTNAAVIGEDIERALELYPVLDDEAHSELEFDEYQSGWEDYGARDFVDHVVKLHYMGHAVRDRLLDADRDVLREFYEAHASSPWYSENSGVYLPIRGWRCDRPALAAFLRKLRKGGDA